MWKKIQDSQYFLFFTKNLGYEICVTDYLSVWTALYSEKEFVAQLKVSNDGLELPHDNDFVQKALYLFSNLDQLKKLSIEKEENGKSLFINMSISFGFPFYFECKLLKGSEELFFQKVTQPFLKTVGDLRASQNELRRLLLKKDSEIEEYKCEGGEIVLRHLKTVAFNDEEHMKKYKTYEDIFGTADIPTSLIERAVEIPEQKILKQETANAEPVNNIKIEPSASIKQEPVPAVKTEIKTETIEEPSVPVITAPVSCKQEVKRETIRTHVPRKKTKFNF